MSACRDFLGSCCLEPDHQDLEKMSSFFEQKVDPLDEQPYRPGGTKYGHSHWLRLGGLNRDNCSMLRSCQWLSMYA